MTDPSGPPAPSPRPSWLAWGTGLGLLSAVGYTLANVSLRSVVGVDPYWVTAVKAVPTVLMAGPWMLWSARRGRVIPVESGLGWLLAAALLGHLGGNVAFQWSLGVVGMALAVPLTVGAMILSSTWLGWRMLGERDGVNNLLATVVLLSAIVVLSQGASAANAKMQTQVAPWWQLGLGVAASIGAGLSYALLGLAIRRSAGRGMPASATLLTVSATGLICVGAISIWRLGWPGLQSTAPAHLLQMMLAGVWNALAFLALTKALAVMPLYYVNALNASQTAMASLAGIWLFGETRSTALLAGVALTVCGLLMIRNK